MRRLLSTVATVLCVFSLLRVIPAQEKLLTLDDIFDPAKKINFDGSLPFVLRWLKGGTHYLQSKADPKAAQVQKVNAVTGEAAPFYDAAKMEEAFKRLPGLTGEDAGSLARRRFYLMNESATAVLLNHANDLFYYEFGSEKALRLTNGPDEEQLAQFSPDGRMVSFIRNNNLYVSEIANQHERALTTDGGAKILNGRLDWVYWDEIYPFSSDDRGYWWSPDSTRIAYYRIDDTPSPEFVVVDHIPLRQTTETTAYPKAGDPNPLVKIGAVSIAGGATRWMDQSKYQPGDLIVARIAWTPDSQRIVWQAQNREQTWLDLNFSDANGGNSKTVFRETTKAWVDAAHERLDNPRWLKDGTFLWLSDRSGWRHLYHYTSEGELIRQVTDGKWEVRSLHGVDEAKGFIYFSGTERSPTSQHVYRTRLDGTGLTRLMPELEGSHFRVIFNPTFTHYIDIWSDAHTPHQMRLFNADGTLARTVDENRVETLRQYKLSRWEFYRVKTRDGFVMEAMMLRPPDFDPKRKYPVISLTYGGPRAPIVSDAWGNRGSMQGSEMWAQLLAQKGYIFWICDNRTASGKGAESAWPLYHNLGELELRDLEDGLTWLKSQPYVDASRIGIMGLSYGGYVTAYALTHSKSFRVGIAESPVTDWRLYTSMYTERYMGTPQNNPQGYEKSSALKAASDLHGKLLLVAGTMDNNVHMQNTVRFAYELQKAGKQFQMMLYPKSRHVVFDPALLKHLRTLETEFILKNL